MKVNLTIDDPNCLNGYLNLDPFIREAGSSKVKCDVMNIDEHIDNGECTELRAYNVLTYYDSNKVDTILNNWTLKLRKNGVLHISDIDINRVFKAFNRGEINLSSLNTLIFGAQTKNWELRKCGLNMEILCEALKGKGLEIIEKTYHQFNFIIKAKRVK